MHTFQSTHPTRECDHSRCHVADARRHFNPRTLQESATLLAKHGLLFRGISIHAPYKRVRQRSTTALRMPKDFNPRTLQESATEFNEVTDANDLIFQSTHPTRECDSRVRPQAYLPCYFNPRTLQESATKVRNPLGALRIISIHAPYKRVRLWLW